MRWLAAEVLVTIDGRVLVAERFTADGSTEQQWTQIAEQVAEAVLTAEERAKGDMR